MEFNIVEKLLAFTLLGSEWVLWLLIVLSVLSLAIAIERLIYYISTRLAGPNFSAELTDRLAVDDLPAIKRLCERSQALDAQMTLRGIAQAEHGVRAMDEAMSGYLIGERHHLDRGLVVLGTLGNNAPFIGLFGTVLGIIQAFNDLAANPAGGPSVVMAGISEALVATAVGLVVAIPAVVAYNGYLRVVKSRLSYAEVIKKLLLTHYSR